jgi:uncharacterized protein YoxC
MDYSYLYAVDEKRLIELLRDQLQLALNREKALLDQIQQQAIQINSLVEQISSLTQSYLPIKNQRTPS